MKSVQSMPKISEKVIEKDFLYAGIPVVKCRIKVPSIEGEGRALSRIGRYYGTVFDSDLSFCENRLLQLAAEDFELCMEESSLFEQFLFESGFAANIDEDILQVRRTVRASFGRHHGVNREITDEWYISSGTPVKTKKQNT